MTNSNTIHQKTLTNYYIYQQYALDVINGKQIACEYVKLACQRYLDWFKRDDIEFRPEKVDKAVNFISHLKHYTGKHNGKCFTLLPYQFWIVANIFGFYYKNSDRRVINYVYIELARKNGKTALIAAILLYMMCGDGESGAEIELVANSAKQAKICFDMCSNFLTSIDPKGKYFGRYRDSIKFQKSKSFLQVLSSDAGGNDGYNSYAFCLDEAHEQKDSRLFDVMTSSQGMRQNPLAIIITTAGFNKFGFCYPYRNTCIEILHGVKEDDSLFTAIYTQDTEDEWKEPDKWIKSNPSLGVTVLPEYLQQQVKKAENNASLEVGTKTKNFNMWVSTSDIWIGNDLLLKYTEKIDLNKYKDQLCYVGIDLAAVSDLTAVSFMIPIDGLFYFKTFYYLPSSCLYNNSNSHIYLDWKLKGYLYMTPGNVTDYDYILKNLLDNGKTLLYDKIAYDQYNATQFSINATSEGLPLEPYPQALWSFNKPTKEFERLLKLGKVRIDDNPITRWCFSNVTLKSDYNENVKPIKQQSQQKIDGVVSMLESLGVYLNQPNYNNEITTI